MDYHKDHVLTDRDIQSIVRRAILHLVEENEPKLLKSCHDELPNKRDGADLARLEKVFENELYFFYQRLVNPEQE